MNVATDARILAGNELLQSALRKRKEKAKRKRVYTNALDLRVGPNAPDELKSTKEYNVLHEFANMLPGAVQMCVNLTDIAKCLSEVSLS